MQNVLQTRVSERKMLSLEQMFHKRMISSHSDPFIESVFLFSANLI